MLRPSASARQPAEPAASVSIGLLGLGNVGAGVVRLLAERGAEIERRSGVKLAVTRAAVRDVGRSRGLGLPAGAVVADARAVVRDPAVQVVVELVGGVEPAGALVAEALELGKPVVTANKLLLAERGEELFALAARKGVALRFEGAVCGGMPIVRLLREALASDRVVSLHGILNGTTNYILTRMTEEGCALEPALREAQAKGYAEADPSLDLGGGDAAQKLCLLARLAFGARVRPADILTEGIERLTPADLAAARELNSVVKLLAVARLDGNRLDMRVHPAMIPKNSPLAAVSSRSTRWRSSPSRSARRCSRGRGPAAPARPRLSWRILSMWAGLAAAGSTSCPAGRSPPCRAPRSSPATTCASPSTTPPVCSPPSPPPSAAAASASPRCTSAIGSRRARTRWRW